MILLHPAQKKTLNQPTPIGVTETKKKKNNPGIIQLKNQNRILLQIHSDLFCRKCSRGQLKLKSLNTIVPNKLLSLQMKNHSEKQVTSS